MVAAAAAAAVPPITNARLFWAADIVTCTGRSAAAGKARATTSFMAKRRDPSDGLSLQALWKRWSEPACGSISSSVPRLLEKLWTARRALERTFKTLRCHPWHVYRRVFHPTPRKLAARSDGVLCCSASQLCSSADAKREGQPNTDSFASST